MGHPWHGIDPGHDSSTSVSRGHSIPANAQHSKTHEHHGLCLEWVNFGSAVQGLRWTVCPGASGFDTQRTAVKHVVQAHHFFGEPPTHHLVLAVAGVADMERLYSWVVWGLCRCPEVTETGYVALLASRLPVRNNLSLVNRRVRQR